MWRQMFPTKTGQKKKYIYWKSSRMKTLKTNADQKSSGKYSVD